MRRDLRPRRGPPRPDLAPPHSARSLAPPGLARRRLIAGALTLPFWPALQGCRSPLPAVTRAHSEPEAAALLAESAAAHGLGAFAAIHDLSVSYAGSWHRLVGKLQPVLVDAGFRGGSEERLLLGGSGAVGQSHTGMQGHKQVFRASASHDEGSVRVWYDDVETQDGERRAAAALVVDGYRLFLMGPLLLAGAWSSERELVLERAPPEQLREDGADHLCDVLRVRMSPGLGFAWTDDLALFIDRDSRLMRRVRFTLNGLDSTRGAIAEVDTWAHRRLHRVMWPTRFHEQLRRPLPLAVHDWRLTGLDIDRGLVAAEFASEHFNGKAAAPAASLAPE